MSRAVAVALLVAGCTSVGGLSSRPAPPIPAEVITLRVCLLRDPAVSPAEARQLMAAWQDELTLQGVRLAVIGMQEWPRPGFTASAIMNALMTVPLERPCDRVLAVIGRHAGDIAWGALQLPEVFGAVNDDTHTHGFVVARTASLTHAVGGGAGDSLVHEGYHLLGCGHWSWSRCYQQVARLRQAALDNAREGRDFVPALTPDGEVFRTREAVNETIGLTCRASGC